MTDRWKVLVPVEVLEGETVPDAVVDVLATVPVVVLGYHVVPEQTAPGQARLQFEDRAQAKLQDLADAFRESGNEVETHLVFTHDEEQTLDRVADETGCNAILIPNPAPRVERLLVPLRGEVNVRRIAAFLAALVGGREIALTLYHVAATEGGIDEGRAMVDNAAAELRERGLPPESVTREVVVAENRIRTIAAAAEEHDAIVMGESEPSLQTFLFGDVSERVAAHSLGPVVVVRRERPPEPSEAGDDDGESPAAS